MQRFKLTREQAIDLYVPKSARRVKAKGLPVEFFVYEDAQGRPCAQCWIGKQAKPAWRHYFLTNEQREKRIAGQIAVIREREDRKAARRKASSAGHNWKPGLILKGTWGYEQTNVDFFKVTRVIGKTMVEIAKIGAATAEGTESYTWGQRYVTPNPDAVSTERHRVKVDASYGNGLCKSPVHGILTPWEGQPVNETSYH